MDRGRAQQLTKRDRRPDQPRQLSPPDRSRTTPGRRDAVGPPAIAETIRRTRSAPPPAAATGAGRIRPAATRNDAVIRRSPNKKGHEVIADLSRDDWSPPGTDDEYEPTRSISAGQMNTLLKSAAVAAYTTYAYHATKSRNVAAIKRDGLDPNRGGSGAAKGTDFEAHSQNKVHYTRNLNTAGAYKDYAEGGMPFGPTRRDADPAEAEILQVAVPHKVASGEQVDPDSPATDAAFTTDQRIAPDYIRSTKPKDIGDKPSGDEERRLEKGANTDAWIAHMREGLGEGTALKSNMDADGRRVLTELVAAGYEEATLLNTIRQALRSMPASDILPFMEHMRTNSRVRSGVDATGEVIPFQHQ